MASVHLAATILTTNHPSILLLAAFILLPILYLTTTVIYNLFFHPLRSFRGPKLLAATRIPITTANLRGQLIYKILALHEEYGPVVRVGPNELSFTTSTAWKTIYGYRSLEIPKALGGEGHTPPFNGVHGIVTAPTKEQHAGMRRAISPAFSDKALRQQEHFLQSYVDLLIKQLHVSSSKGAQNMVEWYNFTTFDAIGDLAFGESFGCLEGSAYHTWITIIFNLIKSSPYVQALVYYRLTFLLKYLLPKKLQDSRREHAEMSDAKLGRRLERGMQEERCDFTSYILKHKDGVGLSRAQMYTMAGTIIAAGSETTATLLSAATYRLLVNPLVYHKLVNEIRYSGKFNRESDITLQTTGELRYLSAVLEESLRIFPPAPATFPRIVQGSGEKIDGHFVPPGVVVGCPIYASSNYSGNFSRPHDFVPERYNPETEAQKKEFANDDKLASNPFSRGPRNCVGRNLAYAEMKLIMARVLWNFDLELAAGSEYWGTQQKAFLVWEKGPLMVNLKPVAHV